MGPSVTQQQSPPKADPSAPVVIALGEDILIANVDAFEKTLLSTADTGKRNLILDLEKVEYFSGLGIGALLRGLKRARETGGEIKLIHVSPSLRRVFDLSGLGNVLDICETEEEAMASFGHEVGRVERTLLWTIRPPQGKKGSNP